MSQLARLNSALATRPNDPFLLYAIAMENLKLSHVDTSLEIFSNLIKSHPQYVPTYLQYGMALAEHGKTESAKEVLNAGVLVAQGAGDSHTAGEIAEALDRME